MVVAAAVAAVMAADAVAMVAVAADVAVMAAVAGAAEIVVATAAIAETAGNPQSSLQLTFSIGATLIPAGR